MEREIEVHFGLEDVLFIFFASEFYKEQTLAIRPIYRFSYILEISTSEVGWQIPALDLRQQIKNAFRRKILLKISLKNLAYWNIYS